MLDSIGSIFFFDLKNKSIVNGKSLHSHLLMAYVLCKNAKGNLFEELNMKSNSLSKVIIHYLKPFNFMLWFYVFHYTLSAKRYTLYRGG